MIYGSRIRRHNYSMPLGGDYMKELKEREKKSHVYKEFQLVGLEIADILKDRGHKALYIKLAKKGNAHELLRLAKDIADRRNVTSKGAYFMAIVAGKKEERPKSEVYRSSPLKTPSKKKTITPPAANEPVA
jgi:hypothetical protein